METTVKTHLMIENDKMDSDIQATTQIRKHQFGLQLLCACSDMFCAYFLKESKQLEHCRKNRQRTTWVHKWATCLLINGCAVHVFTQFWEIASKGQAQMGFYWFNHQILHLVRKMGKQFKRGKSLVDRMATNYLLICGCWRKLIYYTKNPVLHSMLASFFFF